MSDSWIILGIDPGTIITGYGLIKTDGSKHEVIDYGCIRPPTKVALPQRYLALYEGIEDLLNAHNPQALSTEMQFVHKNAQSAMKLGMAKAMVLLSAARRQIPIFEYAPKQAKLAVVGNGNASKEQVQRMIQHLLHLSEPPPNDAADALALALCHAHQHQFYAPDCSLISLNQNIPTVQI